MVYTQKKHRSGKDKRINRGGAKVVLVAESSPNILYKKKRRKQVHFFIMFVLVLCGRT